MLQNILVRIIRDNIFCEFQVKRLDPIKVLKTIFLKNVRPDFSRFILKLLGSQNNNFYMLDSRAIKG